MTATALDRRTVVVNESYIGQRVTGQQRYAREIAARLVDHRGFSAARPAARWAESSYLSWLWALLVLPFRAGSRVLLSMTARAPLWARRHVLVVHDLFVITNPEWFSRFYVLTHAPLLRLQVRRAVGVVAVSQPVADQVAAIYDGPICVAPNAPSEVFGGADQQGTEPDALTARGLVAGSYFLTVGSLDPRKNLPTLAKAYAALGDDERASHPLVIVGGGAAIYRSQDIAWSAEVVDAGYVSDDELRQLYRGCLAVVFVTKAEGFGLPLVEAAAAGARTLVISDIPVFRWVCGDAAYYVDPSDAASVTNGMKSALTEPRDQQVDLTRFTWSASASSIATLCESVAARG